MSHSTNRQRRRRNRGGLGLRRLASELLERRRLLTTLADLDLDGDLDAFYQSVWFENIDGQGNFLAREFSNQQFGHSVAADMDNDGDLDLISSEPTWYENTSDDPRFTVTHPFPSDALSGSDIRTIDFRRDGDVDVLVFTGDTAILYENIDGRGTMAMHERIPLPGIEDADDLDGDGDLDLVILRREGNTSRVILLRNDGNGDFVESLIAEVSSDAWEFKSFGFARFARIDGDSLTDLVITSTSNFTGDPEESISWWRNTGQEFVAQKSFGHTSYGSHRLLDIDFDGDLDHVFSDGLSERLGWTWNNGEGEFVRTPGNGISRVDISLSISPADVNGDEVIDAVLPEFADRAPVWIDGTTHAVHLNVLPPLGRLQPGDANKDYYFDEADLIQVARLGRFQSGTAEWESGDWSGGPGGTPDAPPVGDASFDVADLDMAFATGLYRSGAYDEEATTPIAEAEAMRVAINIEADLEIVYSSATGEVHVVNHGASLSAFQLTSKAGVLNADAVSGFDGPFDDTTSESVFRFDMDGFDSFNLGAILPVGGTWLAVQKDLKIDGARVGGGGLGAVRLTCSDCGLNIDTFQQAMRMGGWPEEWDFVRDGVLDQLDLRFLLQEVFHTTVGDANLDGSFDTDDLVDVFAQAGGEYEDDVVGNSTWSEGDWTGDGEFTTSDLVWAFQIGGYQGTPHDPKPPTGVVEFIEHAVPVVQGNRVNTVLAGDIDGDLDVDVVVGAVDKVVTWHENVYGAGEFRDPKIVSAEIQHSLSYDLIDLDQDGDLDVLSTSRNSSTLAWHENENGEGLFGRPHIISAKLESLQWAVGGDLDKDGDADVVAATHSRLLWFENRDGRGNFGQVTVIDDRELASGRLVDLDLDGDLDVLAEVVWYENNGQGEFSRREPIADVSVRQSIAVDIDGDGDLDLAFGDDEIQWSANDGAQNFQTPRALGVVSYLTSLFAADMDNDGDMDLLSSSLFDNRVSWYENVDGQGTFQTHVVSSNALFAESVAAADIDGDGDLDILSASRDDDRVAWYENQLI